jgi:hypothetical protein
VQEELGEQAYVFAAFTQRRNVNAHNVEAVEQILAEGAFGDFSFEVFVRGGEDADIRLERLIAADAGILAFLKHAQQLALHSERHVADFIKEERAAVALLETADALVHRTGEGTFLVAENLAFQQVVRDRGDVDGHKFLLRTRAELVDGSGDEFLPAPAFTGDHDRGVGA